MRNQSRSRRCLFVSGVLAALASCVSDGGWNQNERQAGGGDDGVEVAHGEIAIDPTGKYLVSVTDDRLVYAELATGQARTLPGLTRVARVTFDHSGRSLFATRSDAKLEARAWVDELEVRAEAELDLTAGRLVRYDAVAQRELWSQPIDLAVGWDVQGVTTLPRLEATRDDRYLVVTYADHVELRGAEDGALLRRSAVLHDDIVDVDLTPDQQRLVITHDHVWEGGTPRTVIELVTLETFAKIELEVPNCADELVLAADGKHAFLAPTRCQKDPVSVIDLQSGRFVRNLPGFGPVALAASGALAVAFLDASNLDAALFDDPKQLPSGDTRYHLMLIDTVTLRFDVVPLGDALPRYAVAPDGSLLLVDSATLWDDGRIRVLDVESKRLQPVLGPGIVLDNYVITRDSKTVFLLDEGLYSISLAERLAQAAAIDFTPTHLNLTPDDALLLLREDDQTLWLYGTRDGKLLRSIDLGAARDPS